MKAEKISAIMFAVLVLGFAGITKADTVEFNLFPLGCPTAFDHNSSPWRMYFNLEDTFSNVSHVYLDWSGEFTAALAMYDPHPSYPLPPWYDWPPPPDDPCIPFPVNVGLGFKLDGKDGHYNYWASTSGGASSYPAPESFAAVSELRDMDLGSWSPVGPYITINCGEPIGRIRYIEHGSLILNSATLIVEGTVIPEPASLLLLGAGFLGLISKRGQK